MKITRNFDLNLSRILWHFKWHQTVFGGLVISIFCAVWCGYQENSSVWRRSRPIPKSYQVNEPIDLVYTWVNGTDARFRADIQRYTDTPEEGRYHDKNELKYSLRSVEKFAPWIRHIFIVTNGQIPSWLNLNHPRITLVSHADICPAPLVPKVLPTFSSFAIETFIHRIPNLSQRFLYFNDDVFLGQPLYLDHLMSDSGGMHVWNAWQLPDCADTCQWRFIGDGTCDLNCLTEMCHYDGGDCDAEEKGGSGATKSEYSGDIANDNGKLGADSSGPAAMKQKNKTEQPEIGLAYAEVDDSRVKKYVINPNGSIPEDYRFSDAPKVKILKKKTTDEHRVLDDQSNNSKATADLSMEIAQNKPGQSVAERHGNEWMRTHFIDSLIYSNFILNRKYGFKERRMIAHVGFLLDRTVMKEMIGKFPKEFDSTRSHRLRNGKLSIQLSFFYYNFLMSEKKLKTDSEIFDEFDVDKSGDWNEREMRALLLKIDGASLHPETLDTFKNIIVRCPYLARDSRTPASNKEKGLAKYSPGWSMPPLSRKTVLQCPILLNYVRGSIRPFNSKYKFQRYGRVGQHSHFIMLMTNVTDVDRQLNELLRQPKLFNCINDDLSHNRKFHRENEQIAYLLDEFFLTLFPNQSQFELADLSTHGFGYVADYHEWLENRRKHICLATFFIGSIWIWSLFYYIVVF